MAKALRPRRSCLLVAVVLVFLELTTVKAQPVGSVLVRSFDELAALRLLPLGYHVDPGFTGGSSITLLVITVSNEHGVDAVSCGGTGGAACATVGYSLTQATAACNSSLPVYISVQASSQPYATAVSTVSSPCAVAVVGPDTAPDKTALSPLAQISCPPQALWTPYGVRILPGALLLLRGLRLDTLCGTTEPGAAANVYSAVHAEGGALIVDSCLFQGNTTTAGRAGRAILATNETSSSIASSWFVGNSVADLGESSGNGGALNAIGGANVSVASCVFIGNTALMGGAIAAADNSALPSAKRTYVHISQSSFQGNRASLHGGALIALGSDGLRLAVESCVFDGNAASLLQGRGGVIEVDECAYATMDRCVLGSVEFSDDQVSAVTCTLEGHVPRRSTHVTEAVTGRDGVVQSYKTTTSTTVPSVAQSTLDPQCVANLARPPRARLASSCADAGVLKPVITTQCDVDGTRGTLTQAPGRITNTTSGNVVSGSAYLLCRWLIEAPPGFLVQLTMCDMDFPPLEDDLCINQYVELWDEDTLIGRYCGQDAPDPFLSSSNTLEVRVAARPGLTPPDEPRFSLLYSFIPVNTAYWGGGASTHADGRFTMARTFVNYAQAVDGGGTHGMDRSYWEVFGSVFMNCRALLRRSAYADGASHKVTHFARALVDNTVWTNNHAAYSCGVALVSRGAHMTLQNSQAYGNTGIWGSHTFGTWGYTNRGDYVPTFNVTNCTFAYNGMGAQTYPLTTPTTPSTLSLPNIIGYDIINSRTGRVIIKDSTFRGATSGVYFAWGGTYIEFDHVVVEDCGQTPTGEVGFMLLDTSWGYMKNTVFRNNKAAYGSAIAMWGSTELHAVNVSVTNSSAAQGGAIFLGSQSYLKVGALSAASNTVSSAGGAVLVQDNARLELVGGTMNGNVAASTGGAIEVRNAGSVVANDIRFADNNGGDFGGAVHATDTATVNLTRTSFVNNQALRAGGAIDVYSQALCAMDVCSGRGNTASNGQGGFLSATVAGPSVGVHVVVSNATLNENVARTGGAIALFSDVFSVPPLQTLPDCSSTAPPLPSAPAVGVFVDNSIMTGNAATDGSGGALLVSGYGSKLVATNCQLAGHAVAGNGAALLAQRTAVAVLHGLQCDGNSATTGACMKAASGSFVEVSSASMTKNRAHIGAAVLISNATVIMYDTHILENDGQVQGGGLATFDDGVITVCNSSLSRNVARVTGGVIALNSGSVKLSDSVIAHNMAAFGGAAYVALGGALTFQRCGVRDNSAGTDGGVVYSYAGRSTFSHSTVSNNVATGSGGVASLLQSGELVVDACTVQSNKATNGGVVVANNDAVVSARRSIVRGNSVSHCGGFAEFLGSSTGRFDTVDFAQHLARQGGVLCAGEWSSVALFGGVASENSAQDRGGFAFVDGTSTTLGGSSPLLNLTGMVLQDHTAATKGGVLFATGSAAHTTRISIAASTLTRNRAGPAVMTSSSTSLGGVACLDTGVRMTMSGCTVTNNQAPSGGALGLAGLEGAEVIMANASVFAFNTARAGGVAHLSDGSTISGDSMRAANNSAIRGGVFFVAGDSQSQTCDSGAATPVVSVSHAAFDSNQASLTGAVGFWQGPCTADSTGFKATATFLGPGSGTPMLSSTSAHLKVAFDASVSPGIALTHALVSVFDRFDNIVVGQSAIVRASVDASSGASLVGQAVAFSSTGHVPFTDLSIAAAPGSVVTVSLEAELAAFPAFPAIALGAQPALTTSVDVHIQPCERGYILTSTLQCVPCQAGEYSWQEGATKCEPCPEGASCAGADHMLPLPDWWRQDNETSELYRCMPGVCSPSGCNEGYTGPLCNQCSDDFGKSGDVCVECPDEAINVLIITLVAALALVVTVVMVQRTRHRPETQNVDVISIATKTLLSYLQFASLAASLDVQWSPTIRRLFSVQQAAGNAGDQMSSTACLLANVSNEVGIAAVYIKVLVFVLMPPLVIVCVMLFWSAAFRYRLRYRKNERRSRAELHGIMVDNVTITCIVILFLLYPAVSTQVFELFSCKTLYGVSRLQADMTIECASASHVWWMLVVGLPGVICEVIGIPLAAFLVLWLRRHQLQEPAVRRKFAFLMDGYRPGAPYWEVVVLSRKVALVAVTILFRGLGQLYQLVMTVLVTILALWLHTHFRPHQEAKLQFLESLSLAVSLLTFVLAQLLLASGNKGPDNPVAEFWVTVIVVAANALFGGVFLVLLRREVVSKAKAMTSTAVSKARMLRSKANSKRGNSSETGLRLQRDSVDSPRSTGSSGDVGDWDDRGGQLGGASSTGVQLTTYKRARSRRSVVASQAKRKGPPRRVSMQTAPPRAPAPKRHESVATGSRGSTSGGDGFATVNPLVQ